MRVTTLFLFATLFLGCGASTKTSEFDFRGHKLSDSFSDLTASIDQNSWGGVVTKSETGPQFYMVAVLPDGSDSKHFDENAVLRVTVRSLPNSDTIGSISWSFPSQENGKTIEKFLSRLGPPMDTGEVSELQIERYEWALSGGGRCVVYLNPLREGMLSADSSEYLEWQAATSTEKEMGAIGNRFKN